MLGNWVVGVGALGAVAFTGCMASGVQFAGSPQPPVATPDGVQLALHPPAELRRLGRVSVECSPLGPDDDVEGMRASDLSCSSEFLRSALREAAAEAGGSFLVEPECRDRRTSGGGSRRVTWLGCDADVFGPTVTQPGATEPGATQPGVTRPGAAQPAAVPVAASALGSLRDAWHISIDFWPAKGRARPAPRAAESVAEVDFPRVGQLRLGDLSATCDDGCASGSMRRGLRAAAAWLGATTLVDVRCIQQERASSCAASIAAPEQDEEARVPTVTSARD
jgi:hypothetical protein